jgi:hypothetical protein
MFVHPINSSFGKPCNQIIRDLVRKLAANEHPKKGECTCRFMIKLIDGIFWQTSREDISNPINGRPVTSTS